MNTVYKMSDSQVKATLFGETPVLKSAPLFPKGLQDSPRISELKEVIYSPLKDDQYLSNIYSFLNKRIGHCAIITGQHERIKTVEFFIKEGFKCLLRLGLAHCDSNFFSSEGGAIPYVILEKDNMIVGIGREVTFIHESTKENIKLIEKFHKSITTREKKPSQISLLLSEYGDLCLKDFETKPLEIDFDLYNDGFEEDYNYCLDFLKSGEPGILLFLGYPGSGKSSLVKTFLKDCDKRKFVYIPFEMVGELGNPTFLAFALDNLKETVLVIEDGDSLLTTYNGQRSPATAQILNLGDGILADVLKMQIIITGNIQENSENIDEAVVRPGRLKKKIKFDKLRKEKAQKYLDSHGIDAKIESDVSLAELFNLGKDNGNKKKESRSMNLFGQ